METTGPSSASSQHPAGWDGPAPSAQIETSLTKSALFFDEIAIHLGDLGHAQIPQKATNATLFKPSGYCFSYSTSRRR